MTNLENIVFPVRKEKVSDYIGIAANRDYDHLVIATIDGQDRLLTACSKRYELVPNVEIFPAIEAELNAAGVKFNADYDMWNFARFQASYEILDNDLSITDGGDVIRPQIKISHSYNRSTKYTITFGYYRLICSNGLTIPVEHEQNYTVVGMHTQAILGSIGKLFNNLAAFLDSSKEVTKSFEVLGDTWIPNWVDRLETVMDATGIKKGQDDIMSIIRSESNTLYDGKVNDWLIYNGINQGYIFNNDINKKMPDVREKLDQKVFEHILVTH